MCRPSIEECALCRSLGVAYTHGHCDDEHSLLQVPAGVVSAAPEARMKPALEATGLEHVFQSVVSGDDVYRGRPDPEAYLYAAQQLGRPSVRCVVIGNSNQVHGCLLMRLCGTQWLSMSLCILLTAMYPNPAR